MDRLIRRIETLEKRVAELETRPAQPELNEKVLAMTDFDQDMLFLSIATANLKKYDVLSIRNSDEDCEIHVTRKEFEQLSQGREITEEGRDTTKYPIGKYFMLHGIKVFAIYPADEGQVKTVV
jgi:ubiquinone biosynthesis protein UbiJ